MKMQQTRDELIGHLGDELEFLQTLGVLFESGREAYAKLLATRIRVLVHDKKTSHSLLGQLGIKERLEYVDTSLPPTPPGELRLSSGGGLAIPGAVLGGQASSPPRYSAPCFTDLLPPYRRNRPRISFAEWWATPVIEDTERAGFNREALVLGLANKDGGAHIDPELEASYAALSRANWLGWNTADSKGNILSAGSPVPANVRQIACEIEATLREQLPKLIPEAFPK